MIQAERLILQSCGVSNYEGGTFIYTRKGGLLVNPLEFQVNNTVIADLELPDGFVTEEEFKVQQKIISPPLQNLVEAEAWTVNSKGKVELVASANHNSNALAADTFSCPF